jgi:hypothetical protein
MTDQSFTAAVLALLACHGGTWSGTMADLHALLRATAPDATRLGKLLTTAADSLVAGGITIERQRQPGTGTRFIVLTRRADPLTEAPPGVTLAVPGVTLPAPAVSKPAPALPERPLFACPACGSREWWWRATLRRSASRWCCAGCVPAMPLSEAEIV